MSDEQRHVMTLFCTRCGTPSTRLYVQAISDDDTCPACGSACWQPTSAPPTVVYALTPEDRAWLRTICVSGD